MQKGQVGLPSCAPVIISPNETLQGLNKDVPSCLPPHREMFGTMHKIRTWAALNKLCAHPGQSWNALLPAPGYTNGYIQHPAAAQT